MRGEEETAWFGPVIPIGQRPTDEAIALLRELGDNAVADELAASASVGAPASFGARELIEGLFNRFVKTTHVCGFLSSAGGDRILPVTKTKPDKALRGRPLKITLDGLHIAKYPGRGTHTLLFDFALQAQGTADGTRVFHYNAKFQARDGETVPVRNFPLFYGLTPSADGITFGFQTVNVASSFDEGLLDFLARDEFKAGLSLVRSMAPVVAQISEMAASLTRWLAGQSRNAKVQEFRQGLDFETGPLGGGLSEGTYIVVQIPVEYQHEWSWDDWSADPTLVRLVQRGDPSAALQFNHLMFGVHRME